MNEIYAFVRLTTVRNTGFPFYLFIGDGGSKDTFTSLNARHNLRKLVWNVSL